MRRSLVAVLLTSQNLEVPCTRLLIKTVETMAITHRQGRRKINCALPPLELTRNYRTLTLILPLCLSNESKIVLYRKPFLLFPVCFSGY